MIASIADSVTGDVSRTITDLEYVQDAIKAGDDIYYAGGESKNWPKATSIIRIKPDDSQEVVLAGKNFKAFARTGAVRIQSVALLAAKKSPHPDQKAHD